MNYYQRLFAVIVNAVLAPITIAMGLIYSDWGSIAIGAFCVIAVYINYPYIKAGYKTESTSTTTHETDDNRYGERI